MLNHVPARRPFLATLLPSALALMLAAAPLAAQDGAVAGQVTDNQTGVGLSAVDIQVLTAEGDVVARGVSSGNGAFRIGGVPTGTYEVLFSVAGWENHRESGVTVSAGELTRLQVAMTPRTFNLNPITVSASRSTQKLLDAPASIQVVDEVEVDRNIALTATEHVEGKAGVDVLRSGLQQSYVVARGFNNVFSGSMLVLNDYRLARVPSLRANIMHLNPSTNLDVDHVEVVLGPASALYGPNAANGVLHVLTKSPIDDPGSTISVAGGFRSQDAVPASASGGRSFDASTEGVLHAEGRFAVKASDEFGAKISGQYFEGTDYLFLDPAEAQARELARECLEELDAGNDPDTDPCPTFNPAASPTTQHFQTKLQRVGARDFGLERWSLDARADWRPSEEASLILSAGWNNSGNSIDLTGIGAGQVRDWLYSYYQARFNYDDLFAQFFLNTSDAGDTYILRTGNPIVDESYVAVGQLQHQLSLGDRHTLTYGADLIRTVPQTKGTVNGRNEDDDQITEIGGYLQAESRLADRWELVTAARVDKHSEIEDPVFSPRAALVYTPSEGHSVRATYNRAFSTPTTNNLFLDISAGGFTIPNTGVGYNIRAMGTGSNGFTFRTDGGRPMMKSPFNVQDPTAFLPTRTQAAWDLAINAVAEASPNPAMVRAAFNAIGEPSSQEVPLSFHLLNAETQTLETLGGFDEVNINDIPPIKEQITNTFEVGYKGLLNDRLLLSGDLWYEQREDFVGPLRVETPNVGLDSAAVMAYAVPRLAQVFVQQGLSEEAAQAQAQALANGVARLPVGVIQPEGVSDRPSLMLTYRNFGDVDLWGGDFRVRYNVDDRWTLEGNASYVNDEFFTTEGDTVFLNAPSVKFGGGVEFSDEDSGLHGQLQGRYTDDFRMNSGVFVGAVDSYFLTDLSLGYDLPSVPGASVQLQVQNLLDESYRSVVGGAEMGRFSMLRLRYSF